MAIFYTVIDLKRFFWEPSVAELKLFNYSITFFLILFPAPFRALYCHNSSNEIPVCLNCGRNYFFFILSSASNLSLVPKIFINQIISAPDPQNNFSSTGSGFQHWFDPSWVHPKYYCFLAGIFWCLQGQDFGAGVFGWSRSCHFGPAPAPP